MQNRVNRSNIDLKRDVFANKIGICQGNDKSIWYAINMDLNEKSKATWVQSLDVDGKRVTDKKSLSDHIPRKGNSSLEG